MAEGMVGAWGRRPALLNPSFELVAGADQDDGPDYSQRDVKDKAFARFVDEFATDESGNQT